MSKKYDGLARNNAHFANPKGPDLFERTQEYFDWIRTRHKNGLWPYARFLASSPNSEADISYLGGRLQKGINLAVQDYLSLSTHPRIKEAATRAIVDFGVHSAGSGLPPLK